MTEEETIITPDELIEALDGRRYIALRSRFKHLEAADIAESMCDLDAGMCALAFRLISSERKAEVFSYLPSEQQQGLLDIFPDDAVTVLLNEMEPVDRTQLLEDLPPELSSKFIERLNPEERGMAWRLLSYPEDSVGRIMSPEFFSTLAGIRVSEAIEHVRWNAARYPEEALNQIFVVDADGKYLGDVSIGALFVAEDNNDLVENIVGSSYVTLSAFDDREMAVDSFRKYDKSALAVIDDNNILVGLVSSDDVFDVAEEEATEDIQQFGGIASLEDSYFQTSLMVLLKKRAGWLALLFLGGLFSGKALRNYEEAIASYAFLVFFLPLIISSGGNTGSQAASLVIRSLAIREFDLEDWYRVLGREILTGVGLGVVLGVMGFFCTLFWGLSATVGGIVFLSLIGVVIFGTIMGSMLPFLLKRVGLDPAVSSSPLIASLVDLFGILIFFNIAIFVMKHFP